MWGGSGVVICADVRIHTDVRRHIYIYTYMHTRTCVDV